MSTATPNATAVPDTEAIAQLQKSYDAHRTAYLAHPFPDARERRAHLYALADALFAHRRQIQEALATDFGAHPAATSDVIEIAGVANRAIANAKHLRGWMRAEKRPIDRLAFGTSSASVAWQPKGVTGIIVPWNFPFDLSLGPLADMLAAGNRVIIKMSEFTPACGALVAKMVAETFDPDHVTVVNGGIELGQAFSEIPWDHLLFTGNPEVGRLVAQAAGANLTPVTLELGGKNPTIFADDIFGDEQALADHLRRVLGIKLVKSGQMCISVDHVLVPRNRIDDFVRIAKATFDGELSDYSGSDNATGIISERHFERQVALVEEARTSGAEVIQLDAKGGTDTGTRRLPVSLVIDPDPKLRMMQEEIFGPVLPVIPYDSLDDAVAQIQRGERPLGLYVFTNDDALARKLEQDTASGGFCVNICAMQGGLHTLGFGGSGNSGYGRHHGHDGFREFSNPRGKVVLGRGAGGIEAFIPPFGPAKQKQIEQMFLLRRTQLRIGKLLRPGRR
ncbi:MAG: aldehyde dehydrogenase [Nocardia sp.]|uniref:aldehyde dehydrogenase family protein n=1 Tax=Nocardia sp. TaxID=1821 RepID=UPI0026301F7E|nr:aldehyde dehydrogenase family protein [Nocardia sp.]MCU1642776.1 aldehyde dehydrogenase [Nocardia sp.]